MHGTVIGKNNGFPFLDILEYSQKSQIWKSETSPSQGTWLGIPWLGLVSLCQIWDFYGYSLNTLKYPKMGKSVIFSCEWSLNVFQSVYYCDKSLPIILDEVEQNIVICLW